MFSAISCQGLVPIWET